MEKLLIKQATITDIPLIKKLAMQVWPQTYTPIVGAEQVAYMLDKFYSQASLEQQMGEKNHWFLICYSDGLPIAFASWAELETGIYKLHKLYIIPDQQGKGAGRAIIDYITGQIKQLHATALHLNVNRYNDAAMAFYEKTGFASFKEEDIDIGNGYYMNDYVLRLPL